MYIHLLQQDNINGRALCRLLEERGHKISSDDSNIPYSKKYSPQIILIDTAHISSFKQPRLSQIHTAPLKIVLLGMLQHFHWFFEFSDNPKGFVCRKEKVENLYQSIQALRNDEVYLSPKVLKLLNQNKLEQQEVLLNEQLPKALTKTELILLREIGKGKTTNQIAEKYFNSKHTINNHRKNIIRKLKLEANLGLIKFSVKNAEAVKTLISLEKHQELLPKFKND
jgi:DNA-binding NarL/FixJ family response regulator